MSNSLLSKKGLTIERLQRFCEIVEAGSIADAVRKNDREQPAYSRDLKALEDYFEEDLFRRAGVSRSGKVFRGLTLRGDLLHRTALQLFRNIERIIDYNEATEQLTLSAEESILHFLLCPALAEITQASPESTIHFQSLGKRNLLPSLINHEAQFVIAGNSILESTAEGITAVPLGTLQFKLYATKQMLQHHAGLPLEELASHVPIVALSDTASLLTNIALSPSATMHTGGHIMTALHESNIAAFLPALKNLQDLVELPLPNPCTMTLSLAWNTAVAEENPYIASVASTLEAILGSALSAKP